MTCTCGHAYEAHDLSESIDQPCDVTDCDCQNFDEDDAGGSVKTAGQRGFLVKFNSVGRGRLNWEERIERPITNEKIVKAVKRKKALMSKWIGAQSASDYGGVIYAGDRPAGDYFIVPGSEQ